MAWLTQPVAELTYQGDKTTTQALVLSTLERFGVPAEVLPTQAGLVARCLTLCANLGLWRCWSDALEFRLEDLPQNATRVTIAAVPNLFRLDVKPGERVPTWVRSSQPSKLSERAVEKESPRRRTSGCSDEALL